MPRHARMLSDSGYLHVIVRGNGKQVLFEEDKDYLYFLKVLRRFSQETEVTVCAYCLMENHVHLLVQDAKHQISHMMKKLGVSYSYFFNHKYDRTGHLFQDRFRSEAVEDDAYLLTVFRYILKNPEKAGICSAKDYAWSSYYAYGDPSAFARPALLEEMIGGREEYEAFMTIDDDPDCMEFEPMIHDDEWAQRVIRKRLGKQGGTVLLSCSRNERDEALRDLKEAGLTHRQIERLTGIPRGVIQRA